MNSNVPHLTLMYMAILLQIRRAHTIIKEGPEIAQLVGLRFEKNIHVATFCP